MLVDVLTSSTLGQRGNTSVALWHSRMTVDSSKYTSLDVGTPERCRSRALGFPLSVLWGQALVGHFSVTVGCTTCSEDMWRCW